MHKPPSHKSQICNCSLLFGIKEVKEYESKTESLEGTISSMSEALSNAKKEIVRLTNELKLENEKNKSLSQEE